jgi:hypothetical protein
MFFPLTNVKISLKILIVKKKRKEKKVTILNRSVASLRLNCIQV